MFMYEIRTFDGKRHPSLIMFALCPSDWAAILTGRNFIRGGHAVEVWRDDRLVYRLGLSSGLTEGRRVNPKAGGVRGLFRRFVPARKS